MAQLKIIDAHRDYRLARAEIRCYLFRFLFRIFLLGEL